MLIDFDHFPHSPYIYLVEYIMCHRSLEQHVGSKRIRIQVLGVTSASPLGYMHITQHYCDSKHAVGRTQNSSRDSPSRYLSFPLFSRTNLSLTLTNEIQYSSTWNGTTCPLKLPFITSNGIGSDWIGPNRMEWSVEPIKGPFRYVVHDLT